VAWWQRRWRRLLELGTWTTPVTIVTTTQLATMHPELSLTALLARLLDGDNGTDGDASGGSRHTTYHGRMGALERLARFDEDARGLKDRAVASAARRAAQAKARGASAITRARTVRCPSRARGAAPRGHCVPSDARLRPGHTDPSSSGT